jgi:hypothetical protein
MMPDIIRHHHLSLGIKYMRKIPIYDVSNKENFNNLILDWEDGIVNSDNFQKYLNEISKTINKPIQQHIEISRNSNFEFGKAIRTASLHLMKGEETLSAESLYQGSKVFNTGNQHWLYDKTGNFSLKTKSKWKNKDILGIDFFGYNFETVFLSELHDILYWLGLEHSIGDLEKKLKVLEKHEVFYFTDCFDGVGKNSQSKSFSTYYWRRRKGESVWDFLTENQKKVLEIINNNFYEKGNYIIKKAGSMKALF